MQTFSELDLIEPLRIEFGALASEQGYLALGRGLEPEDMPAVREVLRRAEEDDYRFHTIVLAVVDSVPFRLRERGAENIPTEVASR